MLLLFLSDVVDRDHIAFEAYSAAGLVLVAPQSCSGEITVSKLLGYIACVTVLNVLDTTRSAGLRPVDADAAQHTKLRDTYRKLSEGSSAVSSDGRASIAAATAEKAVGESGGLEATGSDDRTNVVAKHHVAKKIRS